MSSQKLPYLVPVPAGTSGITLVQRYIYDSFKNKSAATSSIWSFKNYFLVNNDNLKALYESTLQSYGTKKPTETCVFTIERTHECMQSIVQKGLYPGSSSTVYSGRLGDPALGVHLFENADVLLDSTLRMNTFPDVFFLVLYRFHACRISSIMGISDSDLHSFDAFKNCLTPLNRADNTLSALERSMIYVPHKDNSQTVGIFPFAVVTCSFTMKPVAIKHEIKQEIPSNFVTDTHVLNDETLCHNDKSVLLPRQNAYHEDTTIEDKQLLNQHLYTEKMQNFTTNASVSEEENIKPVCDKDVMRESYCNNISNNITCVKDTEIQITGSTNWETYPYSTTIINEKNKDHPEIVKKEVNLNDTMAEVENSPSALCEITNNSIDNVPFDTAFEENCNNTIEMEDAHNETDYMVAVSEDVNNDESLPKQLPFEQTKNSCYNNVGDIPITDTMAATISLTENAGFCSGTDSPEKDCTVVHVKERNDVNVCHNSLGTKLGTDIGDHQINKKTTLETGSEFYITRDKKSLMKLILSEVNFSALSTVRRSDTGSQDASNLNEAFNKHVLSEHDICESLKDSQQTSNYEQISSDSLNQNTPINITVSADENYQKQPETYVEETATSICDKTSLSSSIFSCNTVHENHENNNEPDISKNIQSCRKNNEANDATTKKQRVEELSNEFILNKSLPRHNNRHKEEHQALKHNTPSDTTQREIKKLVCEKEQMVQQVGNNVWAHLVDKKGADKEIEIEPNLLKTNKNVDCAKKSAKICLINKETGIGKINGRPTEPIKKCGVYDGNDSCKYRAQTKTCGGLEDLKSLCHTQPSVLVISGKNGSDHNTNKQDSDKEKNNIYMKSLVHDRKLAKPHRTESEKKSKEKNKEKRKGDNIAKVHRPHSKETSKHCKDIIRNQPDIHSNNSKSDCIENKCTNVNENQQSEKKACKRKSYADDLVSKSTVKAIDGTVHKNLTKKHKPISTSLTMLTDRHKLPDSKTKKGTLYDDNSQSSKHRESNSKTSDGCMAENRDVKQRISSSFCETQNSISENTHSKASLGKKNYKLLKKMKTVSVQLERLPSEFVNQPFAKSQKVSKGYFNKSPTAITQEMKPKVHEKISKAAANLVSKTLENIKENNIKKLSSKRNSVSKEHQQQNERDSNNVKSVKNIEKNCLENKLCNHKTEQKTARNTLPQKCVISPNICTKRKLCYDTPTNTKKGRQTVKCFNDNKTCITEQHTSAKKDLCIKVLPPRAPSAKAAMARKQAYLSDLQDSLQDDGIHGRSETNRQSKILNQVNTCDVDRQSLNLKGDDASITSNAEKLCKNKENTNSTHLSKVFDKETKITKMAVENVTKAVVNELLEDSLEISTIREPESASLKKTYTQNSKEAHHKPVYIHLKHKDPMSKNDMMKINDTKAPPASKRSENCIDVTKDTTKKCNESNQDIQMECITKSSTTNEDVKLSNLEPSIEFQSTMVSMLQLNQATKCTSASNDVVESTSDPTFPTTISSVCQKVTKKNVVNWNDFRKRQNYTNSKHARKISGEIPSQPVKTNEEIDLQQRYAETYLEECIANQSDMQRQTSKCDFRFYDSFKSKKFKSFNSGEFGNGGTSNSVAGRQIESESCNVEIDTKTQQDSTMNISRNQPLSHNNVVKWHLQKIDFSNCSVVKKSRIELKDWHSRNGKTIPLKPLPQYTAFLCHPHKPNAAQNLLEIKKLSNSEKLARYNKSQKLCASTKVDMHANETSSSCRKNNVSSGLETNIASDGKGNETDHVKDKITEQHFNHSESIAVNTHEFSTVQDCDKINVVNMSDCKLEDCKLGRFVKQPNLSSKALDMSDLDTISNDHLGKADELLGAVTSDHKMSTGVSTEDTQSENLLKSSQVSQATQDSISETCVVRQDDTLNTSRYESVFSSDLFHEAFPDKCPAAVASTSKPTEMCQNNDNLTVCKSINDVVPMVQNSYLNWNIFKPANNANATDEDMLKATFSSDDDNIVPVGVMPYDTDKLIPSAKCNDEVPPFSDNILDTSQDTKSQVILSEVLERNEKLVPEAIDSFHIMETILSKVHMDIKSTVVDIKNIGQNEMSRLHDEASLDITSSNSKKCEQLTKHLESNCDTVEMINVSTHLTSYCGNLATSRTDKETLKKRPFSSNENFLENSRKSYKDKKYISQHRSYEKSTSRHNSKQWKRTYFTRQKQMSSQKNRKYFNDRKKNYKSIKPRHSNMRNNYVSAQVSKQKIQKLQNSFYSRKTRGHDQKKSFQDFLHEKWHSGSDTVDVDISPVKTFSNNSIHRESSFYRAQSPKRHLNRNQRPVFHHHENVGRNDGKNGKGRDRKIDRSHLSHHRHSQNTYMGPRSINKKDNMVYYCSPNHAELYYKDVNPNRTSFSPHHSDTKWNTYKGAEEQTSVLTNEYKDFPYIPGQVRFYDREMSTNLNRSPYNSHSSMENNLDLQWDKDSVLGRRSRSPSLRRQLYDYDSNSLYTGAPEYNTSISPDKICRDPELYNPLQEYCKSPVRFRDCRIIPPPSHHSSVSPRNASISPDKICHDQETYRCLPEHSPMKFRDYHIRRPQSHSSASSMTTSISPDKTYSDHERNNPLPELSPLRFRDHRIPTPPSHQSSRSRNVSISPKKNCPDPYKDNPVQKQSPVILRDFRTRRRRHHYARVSPKGNIKQYF